jgi:hypothetical protein
MDDLPIRWFIDEFRAVRGYDNLRAKPTSRLSIFVANISHKGTKTQSKTLDAKIYELDNSLKFVIGILKLEIR